MFLENLKTGKLPREVYLTGLESFVISTVDFVLKRGKEFFLIQRGEGAFTGEWFVAGGRQNRGEEEQDALLRVAKRELGVTSDDIVYTTFSHCQDVCNPSGQNSEGPLPAWHSKWHFYVIEVEEGFEPTLDMTSSTGKWFTRLPTEGVPEPVGRALRKAKLV